MQVVFNSYQMLHLSVTPSSKSWSILVGIMSIGIGAAFYNPDEHPLMKMAYLLGCLFLGLTFLDDWEDCVIDKRKKLVTLTRKTWLETLVSKCTDSKTLVLDSHSVTAVHVIPCPKTKNQFKIGLVLQAGNVIPVSETTSGTRGEQESIAKLVRQILCVERVEPVPKVYEDSDDDDQSVSSSIQQVESLSSDIVMNIEQKDDPPLLPDDYAAIEDEDSSDNSAVNDDFMADF